jgi:hypothetical protein
MRGALFGVVLLCLAACGDNIKPNPGNGDAAPADSDAGTGLLQHCLDQANTLAPAPGGQLPCDLVPPGFGE